VVNLETSATQQPKSKLDFDAFTEADTALLIAEARDNFTPNEVRLIMDAFDRLRKIDKDISTFMLAEMSAFEEKMRRIYPTLPRSMVPFDGKPENYLPTKQVEKVVVNGAQNVAASFFNAVDTKEVNPK